MKKTALLAFEVCAVIFAPVAIQAQVIWTATSSPIQTTLAGGPWTLAQGGPYVISKGTTTSGGPVTGTTPYCSGGVPIVNPASTVNTMSTFYFPFIYGRGTALKGYFDYRPRNVNEATVAALSTDGGMTWQFQQQVENFTTFCPQTDTNGNGNDNGSGHPSVISFGGVGFLYLLDRRSGYLDSAGLLVHQLTPKPGLPLYPTPANTEFGPVTSNVIAKWDFTSPFYSGVTIPVNPVAASTGSGTGTALGMTNTYTYPGCTAPCKNQDAEDLTSTTGGTNTDPNELAWRIRSNGKGFGNGWNSQAPEYTQGVQFTTDTTGFQHIVVQYDWYTTAQGVRNLQAQYTTDGSTWINVGPVQVAPIGGGFFPQIAIDFHALGITSVENNSKFGVRLVSVYDRSANAPTPFTYTAATLGSSGNPVQINSTSGNWRFDEIVVLGTTNNTPPVTNPLRTTGLINPDGILAVVPNTYPFKILYVDKTLSGDFAFPTSQQCGPTPSGGAANHDTETIHIATSPDGVHFTDQGAVNGLNDPTTTSLHAIRYMAPNGSLVKLNGGKWGLFFGGGNCLDGDSDGFHAIMYAESSDLMNWTVVNGIDNPISSVASIPDPNNASVTIPATAPVIGATQPWFGGRVYNPNAMWQNSNTISLIFAGYNAGYSKDLSSYRTIGQVTLSSGGTTLP